MFDYSLPIARRTRQGQDQVYSEYYKELKKRNEKSYGVDSSTASAPSSSSRRKLRKNINGVGHSFYDSKLESLEENRVNQYRKTRDYPVDFISSESSVARNVQKSKIGVNGIEKYDLVEVDSSSDEVRLVDDEEGVDSTHSKFSNSKSVTSCKGDGLISNDVDCEDVSGNRSILNSANTGKCEKYISIDVDDEVVSGNCSILNSISTGEREVNVSGDVIDEVSGYVDHDNEANESEEVVSSSSESEGNDMSDMDYKEDEPEQSQSSDSLETSLSGERGRKKTVEYEAKRGFEEAGKGEKSDFGLKRKKAYGLDMLVDSDINELDRQKNEDSEVNISPEGKCVARRTRSHSNYKFKKNTEPGTLRNLFCFGEDNEICSLSGDDEVEEDTDSDAFEIEGIGKRSHKSRKKSDSNQNKHREIDDKGKKCPTRKKKSDLKQNKLKRNRREESVGRREMLLGEETKHKYGKIDHETYQAHLKAGAEKWESKTNNGSYFPSKSCDDELKCRTNDRTNDSNVCNVQIKNRRDSSEFHSKAFSDKGKSGKNEANVCDISEKGSMDSDEEFTLKKHKGGNKNLDVFNILADSIFKGEDLPIEGKGCPTIRVSNNEGHESGSLPLKFKFGVEESIVPKILEKLELDNLWAELEFCLRSSEMSSLESDLQAEIPEMPPSHSDFDQSTSCARGVHHLVLDEEIGVRCTLCSYVKLEVKYMAPSFDAYPFGKPSRRYHGPKDGFTFNDLHNDDSSGDFHVKSDSHDYCDGTVWDIIPGIKKGMYPHQCEGFEFLWKNIAGGIHLKNLRGGKSSDEGSGCIISHAPGTGKTRLTIVFLQTYMELYPTCRPVIVAPRTMLLTWEEEFQKWKVGIPFHNLNKTELSGKESLAALQMLIQDKQASQNITNVRMVKLYSWKNEKSILGISYRLFDKLAGARVNSERKKVRQILLEFPGIIFFDEGHIPRNDDSLIWRTLTKLKTEKRVILSGTPFQNNFTEFYNTIRLVRPKFAQAKGEVSEKKRGRKRKASRGKWDSLISHIGKDADDTIERTKLKEVREMIDPFVHIHRGTILQERLKGLRNSVIILQPTELQASILQCIKEVKNPLELDYFEALISVHPSLFLKFNRGKCPVDMVVLEKLRLNVDSGVKMKFIMELIRLSEPLNEKVLIFSQYLEPLSFIRKHLESHFSWSEGKEVLCMDGKRNIKMRQTSINIFNDPTSEARVLLASTRACSEGINLVGASRVVLLDVVWNPSVERQAICRAYRLGQEKLVYTYHLIASGTGEGDKYDRQVEKDRISKMVFSSSAKDQEVSPSVLDDKILEAMVVSDRIRHIFKNIRHVSKESNLIENFGLVEKHGDQSSPS